MKLTQHSCLYLWQRQLVKQRSGIVVEFFYVISDVHSWFILITSLNFLITVLFLLYALLRESTSTTQNAPKKTAKVRKDSAHNGNHPRDTRMTTSHNNAVSTHHTRSPYKSRARTHTHTTARLNCPIPVTEQKQEKSQKGQLNRKPPILQWQYQERRPAGNPQTTYMAFCASKTNSLQKQPIEKDQHNTT
jgi:hypothetical protein